MFGRRIRVAFLALASWAVLFAPGAAVDDAAGRAPSVDPERVAAAVIAPTFGTDAVVVARPCRDDSLHQLDCEVPSGSAPAALEVPDLRTGTSLDLGDQRKTGAAEVGASAPTRGPPTD